MGNNKKCNRYSDKTDCIFHCMFILLNGNADFRIFFPDQVLKATDVTKYSVYNSFTSVPFTKPIIKCIQNTSRSILGRLQRSTDNLLASSFVPGLPSTFVSHLASSYCILRFVHPPTDEQIQSDNRKAIHLQSEWCLSFSHTFSCTPPTLIMQSCT